MTTPAPPRQTTRRRRPFGDHVAKSVSTLQAQYLKELPSSLATMARLRSAAGTVAGSRFDILDVTAVDPQFLPDMFGDDTTAPEHAMHAALTLYAVHQQSYRERGLHANGVGFGQAIRRLAEATGNAEAVRRRFAALGTASTFPGAIYHARALIRQLRDERIPLDYGLLADDLAAFQRPGGPAKVRAMWGREYHRTPITTDSNAPEDES
ncbi:type I-E CRISPR-associated protein Cse2/CasB [Longispora sp. K20-0274]|uniref:type I-E CRISPR-associated protein Cse2/CasB n=1 Tax=Longispora sp. K20-0274 TaxID=3088255 RepID=UPI00399B6C55